MKRCPQCRLTKPLKEFPRNRSTRDGYAVYCKPCHNARGRSIRDRLWGGTRFYHLKHRYGMARSDFDSLMHQQRGLCAICGVEPASHVDHDHGTGKVRGLLCFNCNGGLGQFKDDPMRLALAISYLQRLPMEPSQTTFFREAVGP
jgi:hypothetical protein